MYVYYLLRGSYSESWKEIWDKNKLLKVLIHGNGFYSLLHFQQSPEGSEGKEAPKVTKQEVNDLSV